MNNTPLIIALALSMAAHAVVLSNFPPIFKNNTASRETPKKEIQIFPQTVEKISQNQFSPKTMKSVPQYNENFLKKFSVNTKDIPPQQPRIIEENLKDIILSQTIQDKKLEKNSSYINYYKSIRETIRRNAFSYYNNREEGEIFLSFIVLQNGQLDDIYINQNSSDNKTLKDIAVHSVKDAAPFNQFPEELKEYLRLQFNISIRFKNN